ncbi:aminotransferase class V-fold PLP-dependent enzyme [Candidatus Carsonella ruddii]|uniref:aminotransferase class V-fold PLP-dependent enzyme n=1 Tax=Carsonella ruddii TaxID=114186 RepID=UPI003D9A7489
MFIFLLNYKKMIYFDNSSTNQKPNILFKSSINILQKKNFNLNKGNYNLLDKNLIFFKKIKFLLKYLIKCNFIEELIFFFNSTFSINFIFFNLINFININNEILISNKEHNSVFISLIKIFKYKKCKIIIFPTIKQNIFLNIICNYINEKIIFCIINQISNNFGIINKIKNILSICNYNNIISIVDITQSISSLNINIKKIKPNFLFFSLHKLYSLTGISILFLNINLLSKIKPLFVGGGSSLIFNYNILYKKFNEKFYFGTQNIYSLFSSYYSLKWFLSNKKFIFYINLYLKKKSFILFKKKKIFFTNIFLLKCKNIYNFNMFLDINKIIIRCDNLCNFMKNMFINKKNNCRISINFFNKLKEILKMKFLIFFFNFRIKNY